MQSNLHQPFDIRPLIERWVARGKSEPFVDRYFDAAFLRYVAHEVHRGDGHEDPIRDPLEEDHRKAELGGSAQLSVVSAIGGSLAIVVSN
jgi:hypothetical protein